MGNTDRVYRQGDTFWGEKKGRELFLGEKKRGIFFSLKGQFAGFSSTMNYIEVISEKKILFTGIKTDQYFPRYRQPMVAFCQVWKKRLDGRNAVGWKAARTSPQ